MSTTEQITESKTNKKMKQNTIKLNEAQLKKIVAESVKRVLKEDKQRLPFASVLEYANEEMPFGFTLSYDDKSGIITLKQDNFGLSDISTNGYFSGYFDALSRAFKVIEKYTLGGTGYEGMWINAIGGWKGKMTIDVEKGMYFTDAQFSGFVDNGKDKWTDNPYDDTYYYEELKKPDWYETQQIDSDSKVDNRKSAKSLRYQLSRADKEQLHSNNSANRDVMDINMIRKLKGNR